MADVKISALSSATTPLSGTEVVPVVQGGVTYKTAVSNIAALASSGVTSVGMSVPIGLSVSGSPITSTGTLAVSYSAGYSIPTTSKQSEWDTAYGWGNHASAGYLTSATAATTYQPLDGDLTAIAGLSGTSGLLKKTAANTWTLDTTSYLSGTVAIANGGTGGTTASTARSNLLPAYTSNATKVLAVNAGATDVEWITVHPCTEQETEKAEDLLSKYYLQVQTLAQQKKCALIAVDEILNNMMLYEEQFDAGKPIHHRNYWQEVKQEIEKL